MTTRIAMLHYSTPPVVGGVEQVILAHARLFAQQGCLVRIITGRGDRSAFPDGVEVVSIPEIASQHPEILRIEEALSAGVIPDGFAAMVDDLTEEIHPQVEGWQLIAHNVFTKHFNLALTAALHRLLENGALPGAVAWCHDISWTSPNSQPHLHAGYPWNLLRTYRPDLQYVAVSEQRRQELASSFGIAEKLIKVIYNGVDPQSLWGLNGESWQLVQRLGWCGSGLNLIMPVRVTRAKNIEFALRVVARLKELGLEPRLALSGPPDPHSKEGQAHYLSLLDLRRELDLEKEAGFVYECGPVQGEPYLIGEEILAGLLRACDLVLMPSLREGFGMPVLEGGLLGKPVFCTEFPAAREIGKGDVYPIDLEAGPDQAAELIAEWAKNDHRYQLARRVRRDLTWQAIFQRDILPLVDKET